MIDWYILDEWKDRLILNAIWLIGWGLPAYAVGSFLQIVFLDIMSSIPQKNTSFVRTRSLNSNVAEAVYGVILSVMFLAQTYVFSWIVIHLSPSFLSETLSMCVNIIMIAWATSFSAFESQLIIRRKSLRQRIDFFERNWAYALGFGLPAALIYNLAPSVFATGMWQFSQLLLTFRISLVSLRQIDEKNPPDQTPLRIFKFAEVLANQLIYYLDMLIRSFF